MSSESPSQGLLSLMKWRAELAAHQSLCCSGDELVCRFYGTPVRCRKDMAKPVQKANHVYENKQSTSTSGHTNTSRDGVRAVPAQPVQSQRTVLPTSGTVGSGSTEQPRHRFQAREFRKG